MFDGRKKPYWRERALAAETLLMQSLDLQVGRGEELIRPEHQGEHDHFDRWAWKTRQHFGINPEFGDCA